ncbi:hypothetical protein DSM43276_02647 [Mycobacteroides salmoniphilum]|nr:hypothetical protein DSM43276_02647 [Mycobacteroides salmoniphilum]
MNPNIRSGRSIVDGRNTAGAAKGRDAFDVDALVTRTGGSTTGKTHCVGRLCREIRAARKRLVRPDVGERLLQRIDHGVVAAIA